MTPATGPARRAARGAAPALARFVEARTQGLIDRLLRGRIWVGFVGALLAGIVFLNVSLLQLNQEIARTTAHATVLDRQNSGLRARLSLLDSSERIQRLALAGGMLMPAPDQYRYLRARPWLDAELAARRTVSPTPSTPPLYPPAQLAQAPAPTTPPPATTQTAAPATGTTPTTQAPATAAPPAAAATP